MLKFYGDTLGILGDSEDVPLRPKNPYPVALLNLSIVQFNNIDQNLDYFALSSFFHT